MTAMFFLFSNGSVLDLLLRTGLNELWRTEEQEEHELDEIKDRHTVPHGTQQTVAVRGEENVALSVNCATYV